MTAQLSTPVQQTAGFDLVRLSKSKKELDLSPNTIRAYFLRGLPHYRMGKAVFISRAQLHQFITTKGAVQS
jgi:hypothetical protein